MINDILNYYYSKIWEIHRIYYHSIQQRQHDLDFLDLDFFELELELLLLLLHPDFLDFVDFTDLHDFDDDDKLVCLDEVFANEFILPVLVVIPLITFIIDDEELEIGLVVVVWVTVVETGIGATTLLILMVVVGLETIGTGATTLLTVVVIVVFEPVLLAELLVELLAELLAELLLDPLLLVLDWTEIVPVFTLELLDDELKSVVVWLDDLFEVWEAEFDWFDEEDALLLLLELEDAELQSLYEFNWDEDAEFSAQFAFEFELEEEVEPDLLVVLERTFKVLLLWLLFALEELELEEPAL